MNRRVFLRFSAVVVGVACVLAATTGALAQGRGVDGLERAKIAQEKHTQVLMAKEGVEGTAIGYDDNGQAVVKIFTAGPEVAGLPERLDEVPVQVVVTGKIYALDDRTRYSRPVPIGVSTGHPDITAGTIGCRVKDISGNVYALSNNHVYANCNEASIGDNVLQPGAYDGGSDPLDAIGTLFAFEPIVFHPRANNTIDAAIACSSTDLLGAATPADGYGAPSSTTAEATLGMSVKKRGRTTLLTHGAVTMLNVTTRVSYDGGVARFVGQIGIEGNNGIAFSAGGDSGSLIVTETDNKPVGLLFAGSSTITIANPIGLVLNRFNVTIDDGSTVPPQNQAPTADFTYTTSDLTVDFTDQSTDSDGSISSWAWDLGDGATSTAQNPSHTYAAAGTYAVTLTVTDDDGATGICSQDVTVTQPGDLQAMEVESITFTTAGPHLKVFIKVVASADGAPLDGIRVDAQLTGDAVLDLSGVTNSAGQVDSMLKGGASGSYTATVYDLIDTRDPVIYEYIGGTFSEEYPPQ